MTEKRVASDTNCALTPPLSCPTWSGIQEKQAHIA